MDGDRRKSGVSSFYGKNSSDGLSPQGNVDLMHNGLPHSAGYNNTSFLDAGRQEPLRGGRDEEADGGLQQEETWDVYADFNNAGPRYSTVPFGTTTGYRQIPTPDGKGGDEGSTMGPVEMVIVPTLGPEWKASEMRDMTKAGKREKKTDAIQRKWKGWNRDERGCFGGCLTRKRFVWGIFALAVVTGFTLAFTIPRIPGLEFNSYTPLIAANGTFNSSVVTEFSRTPANFSFPAFASLQVDTSSNFLPLTFNHITAQVFDLDTGYQIATADISHQTFKAKAFSNLNLPLNFSYVADNASDPTWVNWYTACENKGRVTGGIRPGVNFRLDIFMDIAGIPGTKSAVTQVSGASCPIELPADSV